MFSLSLSLFYTESPQPGAFRSGGKVPSCPAASVVQRAVATRAAQVNRDVVLFRDEGWDWVRCGDSCSDVSVMV